MVLAAVVALTSGCVSAPLVHTGDTPPPREPSPPAPSLPAPADNRHLANAYDYFTNSDNHAGYYFKSPSGRWRCAILPHSKAGCQSASGSAMGIRGEPDTVTATDGTSAAPNAIVVDNTGDAHFASLPRRELSPAPGAAKVLPFNKVLDVAGFRCNFQESTGVSCGSELTAKGFTFSRDGYTLQYTDVPDNAPV